jgi:acetyltransferase-like isoleucine patch superfamily enzyme
MNQRVDQTRVTRRNRIFNRRQPATKTVRDLLTRHWIKTMIALAPVLPVALRLAEGRMGFYKDRRRWLPYFGHRAYISSKAQISCANLSLGSKCFIDDYVTIYAHPKSQGRLTLADNVHIYRWSMVELGDGNAGVTIGSHTYIQSGCVLNAFVGNIVIGSNCMIAPRCAFMPYRHNFEDTGRPMREQPLSSRGDIVIEDDVWLGVNVSVLDGVTISQGSIVGAGAVVTKDIPAYCIVAGAPARVIRQRESLNL